MPGTPIVEGFVERDGVKTFYEVYGEGNSPTVLLLPAWTIVTSASGRCRCRTSRATAAWCTFDGQATAAPIGPRRRRVRGAGERRPCGRGARRDQTTERGRRRAVDGCATRHCCSPREHPERVQAPCSSAPRCRSRRRRRATRPTPAAENGFDVVLERYDGWDEVQPALLAEQLRGLPRVLLRPVLPRASLDEADRGRTRLGTGDDARGAASPTAQSAGLRDDAHLD